MPLEDNICSAADNLPKELYEAFKSRGYSTDEQKRDYIVEILSNAGWQIRRNIDFPTAVLEYVAVQKSVSRENRNYNPIIKPKKALQ